MTLFGSQPPRHILKAGLVTADSGGILIVISCDVERLESGELEGEKRL